MKTVQILTYETSIFICTTHAVFVNSYQHVSQIICSQVRVLVVEDTELHLTGAEFQ